MNREGKNKFGNFVHEQRKKEEEVVEICQDIFRNSRNELAVSMRFLQSALSGLKVVPSAETQVIGTDGKLLYVSPQWLLPMFMQNKIQINRLYLHELLHCLFCHLWSRKEREWRIWDLAADIAAESILDELYQKPVYIRPNSFRRECYQKWREKQKVLTAEKLYYVLLKYEEDEIVRLEQEFRKDDHHFWYTPNNRSAMSDRQKKWEEMRRKMQTEMELFSKEAAGDSPGLVEHLQAENRKRYDYREFLRKFSVLKEEMQVDMDSFDPIYYHFGMETYGNMPLIEPLETKEMKKIEDFVIVIDTSMSCNGSLIRRFLEETYSVLSESESFFRKIQVHIIQCDEKIQDDQVIHNQKEMEAYLLDFTVRGFGGTDFRPAFAYVEHLLKMGAFQRLRGLLYFTDGYGVFPAKMPPYDTAFVFMKDDYRDVDVPPWAIKLILDTQALERTEDYYEY